jgi:hypothetical protein
MSVPMFQLPNYKTDNDEMRYWRRIWIVIHARSDVLHGRSHVGSNLPGNRRQSTLHSLRILCLLLILSCHMY